MAEELTLPNIQQAKNNIMKWLQTEMEKDFQIITHKRPYESKIKEHEGKIENLIMIKKRESFNIEQLQEEYDLKQTDKLAKEKIVDVLEEELRHLDLEMLTLKNVSDNKTSMKHIIEEVNIFSQFLGLQMNKVKGGWLQFVFTKIDVNKPDAYYIFSLKLDPARKYIVADCHPEIGDLEYMVEKLNSTNNLSAFVHAARKRFVSIANK